MTSQEIATTKPDGALTIQITQTALTEAQLKAFGIENAPYGDQLLFLHTCQRTGLDPGVKQIYMIGRGNKYTIQTGIDGYRVIADRTGKYVGSDEEWVEGPNGRPLTATVTVYKLVQGQVFPFKATAHWSEYAQEFNGKLANMWAKMPHRMLAKCAESLALRKAFPADLSGIYTDEEMSQADTNTTYTVVREDTPTSAPVRHELPTKGTTHQRTASQNKQLHALKTELALDDETWKKSVAWAAKDGNITSSKYLTEEQATNLINFLKSKVAEKSAAAPVVEDNEIVDAEVVDDGFPVPPTSNLIRTQEDADLWDLDADFPENAKAAV